MAIAWCIIHRASGSLKQDPFSRPFETVQHLGKPPGCKMWCVVTLWSVLYKGTCRTVQSCRLDSWCEEVARWKKASPSLNRTWELGTWAPAQWPGLDRLRSARCHRYSHHLWRPKCDRGSFPAVFCFGPGSQKSLAFCTEESTGGGGLPCEGPAGMAPCSIGHSESRVPPKLVDARFGNPRLWPLAQEPASQQNPARQAQPAAMLNTKHAEFWVVPLLTRTIYFLIYIYMEVSWNGGTSESSILVGFSLLNQPLLGTPIYGTPPYVYIYIYTCIVYMYI